VSGWFELAAGTLTMRPYVFAFFAAYLLAAVLHLGWRATLSFTVIGYLISFVSEVASINTGFPYGWYYYIDATSNRELWIAGVPFFDSLSYVFLSYCSYSTALFILAPLRGWRWALVPLETRHLRRSFAVLFLGSLLQTYLDIIIDPVSLQGSRWFLGQIYGYRELGHHFGVPLSNYLGWWLVSALMICALQRFATRDTGDTPPAGVRPVPFKALLGPFLFLSVIAFNLTMAVLIGEMTIAVTGLFIVFLPLALCTILVVRRCNRYHREDLAESLRDYPWQPTPERPAPRG
jgi:putative membrane protein